MNVHEVPLKARSLNGSCRGGGKGFIREKLARFKASVLSRSGMREIHNLDKRMTRKSSRDLSCYAFRKSTAHTHGSTNFSLKLKMSVFRDGRYTMEERISNKSRPKRVFVVVDEYVSRTYHLIRRSNLTQEQPSVNMCRYSLPREIKSRWPRWKRLHHNFVEKYTAKSIIRHSIACGARFTWNIKVRFRIASSQVSLINDERKRKCRWCL